MVLMLLKFYIAEVLYVFRAYFDHFNLSTHEWCMYKYFVAGWYILNAKINIVFTAAITWCACMKGAFYFSSLN